jgi:hypothetical protein
MTLENPKQMIRKRWQSVMGYYPIGLYERPLSTWPADAAARFKALTSKECVYWNKFSILDKSDKELMTIEKIDRAIGAWKRQGLERGVPEEKLALVCIDWLKYIDLASVPGVSKNSRSDEPIALAIQALGKLAKKHRVIVWTAQQVNRKGQTKEVLGPEDIADSTAIQNYLDLGIAFARPALDAQKQTVTMDGSASAKSSETDRQIVVSCFKSRESSLAGSRESIYQNPSLRLWASKEQCLRTMAHIKNEDPIEHYCRGGGV